MLSNINKMAYFYTEFTVRVTILKFYALAQVVRSYALLMRLHRGVIILTNAAVYYFISLQRTTGLFQ